MTKINNNLFCVSNEFEKRFSSLKNTETNQSSHTIQAIVKLPTMDNFNLNEC